MPYEFPVERGKIREFARATRSTNPAYLGVDAVVPATFLTTAQLFWATESSYPPDFDLMRVLHAEQEYIFHGPPPKAGQTLTVSTRLGDRWEKEGGRGGRLRFAVLVQEFRDETGELVAEEHFTLVETGQAPA